MSSFQIMVNLKYAKCDVAGNANVKINTRSKLKKIIKKTTKTELNVLISRNDPCMICKKGGFEGYFVTQPFRVATDLVLIIHSIFREKDIVGRKSSVSNRRSLGQQVNAELIICA